MAVGQVDIVVGIPTLNNADTIVALLRTIHAGLARHFPRARLVIIAADGGSNDGTPEIASDASLDPGSAGKTTGLRTRHQIGTTYRGVPGRASAVRLIFTAADLLQARSVVLIDPSATGATPDWIGALLDPVEKQSFDLVAPVYDRHPLEGLLVTQLVRPLMRAAYGRQIDEPLLAEFGCSGHYAVACLMQDVWDRTPLSEAIEIWLAASAVASEFRACQASLGPRTAVSSPRSLPSLGDVFPQIAGALFACLERHASTWLPRTGGERLPVIGAERGAAPAAPTIDPVRLGATFRDDVQNLRPVLASILAADTFATLSALTDAGPGGYPDEAWVATVYDFVAAHHAGVMDRAHIAQALMPLYMGRAASFVTEHANAPDTDAVQGLERLSQQFERRKPYLIDRWNRRT
jgi:hypothetical protein